MFAVERTANIKNNPPQTLEIICGWRSENKTRFYCPKGGVFLTFCPLSRKLKEKFLCDLCDSSEAGGESRSKK
jgi:predicted RNA-binding Zn-ribbon protein involved in translation (DUF1610 family)